MPAPYSLHSPIPITYFRKGVSLATQPATDIIPIPLGWNASLRFLVAQVTTTIAGGTLPWAIVQVGDGITVNRYAQVQIGNTATPAVAGTSFWTIGPPPLAGVATAGSATASNVGQSQSGLTGRNPANAAVAGVSGPFLFTAGSVFGAASLTATIGLTGFQITYVIPTGSGLAGVIDLLMMYEMENAG